MKIKKYDSTNGWEQQYPETNVGAIVTSNDIDSLTGSTDEYFLRADGSWAKVETSGNQFVNITGDTMTGELNLPSYVINTDFYHTWTRKYTVSTTTPATLLYKDGNALPNGGVYRFTAHIAGTGTDNMSQAVFWNRNGTWKVNVIGQAGTSSNHPEFVVSSGVPKLTTDHSSNYTISVFCERMELEEGTGTDNAQFAFGAGSFLGSVNGVLRYNSGGGSDYTAGSTVWHSGNDGSGSGLDADTLDTYHATDFVAVTGDTMTGDLSIENGGPNLTLKDTTDSDDISFHFKNSSNTVVGAITTAGNQLNIETSFTNGLEIDADKTFISGQTKIGSGLANARSTYGLTAGFTSNSTFSSNADVSDSNRTLSLVNESTTTNTYSTLSFRNSPSSGTSMADFKYVHRGTNSGDLIYTNNNGGTWSDQFSILSNGNVGIGTTSPGSPLTVSGTIESLPVSTVEGGDLRLRAATGKSYQYTIDNYNDTLRFVRQNDTTGSSGTVRMIIDSSGNVGIGTASPNSKLHILNADPILTIQDTETTGASSDARLRLAESTTGNVIDQYWDIKKEGDNFKLQNKYGTTVYDRFTINGTNGNIGIGTTSPSEKLEVAGNINADELHLNDTNTKLLEGSSNSVRIQTSSGWIDVGPRNTSWSHFYTDRPRFYFGTGIDVDGDIRAYSNNTTKIQESTGHIFELGNRVATLASPALTGTPTAPTAAANTNNTQIATTAFVQNKLSSVAGGLNFKGTVSLATSKSGDDLYGTGSGQISSSGDYLIVSNAGDITNPTTRIITLAAQSPGDESDSTLPITLEVGDWIMYQSFSSQTLTVVLLNNNDASKAAAVHTHSQYLEKAGGTMTGELIIDNSTTQRIRLYTESGTSQIADTFADTTTDKSYIYFDAGTSSNDPGFIMHETSNSETNEGVLHLVPSDDNSYGDYVSIHGTNDPDKLKLHTDGTIEGVSNLSLSGNITVGGTVDGVDVAAFKTAYDSHNHDHSDGNFTVNGDLYGKSVNGQYSNLYRFGGIYFTWDSDSYGTNTNHSIRSTYGDSYGDHITLNSYGHIRMNIDSNNNGTNYFEVGGHTTGTSNTYFQISDTGTTIFPGLSLGISNTNADPGTGTYFRGNSTHFVLGLDSGNTLYLNYGNSAGNFRTYGTHYHNDNAVGTPWGSSNDGSGSGLDADTLDGIDSTSFLRSDADDTMTGDLLLSNAALSYQGQNGVAVPIPQGGLFATTSSTQTGYLKITLPVSWTSTMLSFFVDIYEYTADESFTIQLAGYNYSSSSQWINTTANLVSSSKNRVFNVRFGHDGSKCAIYIGESNSTWAYMQVRVRDFLGGYSNATPSHWADGWAVGFTTSLGTITSTQALESVVTDADTLDGYDSSQFLRSDTNDTYQGTLTLHNTSDVRLPNSSSKGISTSDGYRVINSLDSVLRIGDTGKHNIVRLHGQGSDDFKVYYNSTDYEIYHEGNLDGQIPVYDGVFSGQALNDKDEDVMWSTGYSSGGSGQPTNWVTVFNVPGPGAIRGFQVASYFGNSNEFYMRSQYDGASGSWNSWERLFTEAYHPNADKWTTARTITLGGDLSGSVSLDGSANVTLTATVANDSHTHSEYLLTAGDTMSGDLTISKTSPSIILSDTNTATGNYPKIQFDTNNNQGIKLYHTEFDSELPVGGYGLVVAPSDNNTQFPTTGTLSLAVLGEIYAGNTSLGSTNKVFHDAYHPNADKWTTARTITLGGDLTGNVSIDGSANVTLSAQVTALDDKAEVTYTSGGTTSDVSTLNFSLSGSTLTITTS